MSGGWRRRLGVGAAVGLLVLSSAALLARSAPRPAAAQAGPAQSVTFVGTVLDSVGAPPPTGSTLKLVLAPAAGNTQQPPYCATGSPDANGFFRLTLIAFAPACTIPGTVLQLRVNDIVATPTVIVPPGPGTVGANFSLAVPLGGRPVVPATPVPHMTQLNAGCSQVVLSLGAGATPAQASADVTTPSAVEAIWHYDNALQHFTGYFPDPSVPSDLTSLAPVDTVFICVSSPTTITAP